MRVAVNLQHILQPTGQGANTSWWLPSFIRVRYESRGENDRIGARAWIVNQDYVKPVPSSGHGRVEQQFLGDERPGRGTRSTAAGTVKVIGSADMASSLASSTLPTEHTSLVRNNWLQMRDWLITFGHKMMNPGACRAYPGAITPLSRYDHALYLRR